MSAGAKPRAALLPDARKDSAQSSADAFVVFAVAVNTTAVLGVRIGFAEAAHHRFGYPHLRGSAVITA
jgi:hypothetical protein